MKRDTQQSNVDFRECTVLASCHSINNIKKAYSLAPLSSVEGVTFLIRAYLYAEDEYIPNK